MRRELLDRWTQAFESFFNDSREAYEKKDPPGVFKELDQGGAGLAFTQVNILRTGRERSMESAGAVVLYDAQPKGGLWWADTDALLLVKDQEDPLEFFRTPDRETLLPLSFNFKPQVDMIFVNNIISSAVETDNITIEEAITYVLKRPNLLAIMASKDNK